MANNALIIAFVGLLVFFAHLSVALFRKTRIPDVLLLILIGLILGPILHVVHPDHFGKVGPVFSQIALAIILFEGGLEARLDILKDNWKSCLLLVFPVFLLSFLLGAVYMSWIVGLDAQSALFFGAIVGSTSPSVVVPLVAQLRLKRGPSLILTLESALADVLCLVLALSFLEASLSGGLNMGGMVMRVAYSFILAGAIGWAAGWGWSLVLSRLRSIQNNIFLTLALVFVLFGAMDSIHVSGGVAVLAFGMSIRNAGVFPVSLLQWTGTVKPVQFTDRERAFFSEAVFLIKTFFFVYLGISLHLQDWRVFAAAIALVSITMAFRLPIVRMAMPVSTSKRDASLMGVMVPKGLAAAVMAALPLQYGWPGGEIIRDLSYALILFSILGASAFVFLVEATPVSRLYRRFFRGFSDASTEIKEPAPPSPREAS
jgi:potassium/hydrogen antiporter